MKQFRVGVDGGGTTTRAVVINEANQVLGRALGDSSNLYNLGLDTACDNVRKTIEGALLEAGLKSDEVASYGFGLAGISGPEEKSRWQAALRPLFGEAIAVDEDVVAAWAGALGEEGLQNGGAVLIAGTGANCFGQNAQGARRRVDGWGPLLGDRGSGYDLGESGIRAAVAAHDGAAPATILLDALLESFAVTDLEALVGVVYAPDFRRDRIAGFVPQVLRCAREGDAVANQLLTENGQKLGRTASAVLEPLGLKRLALTGGLLEHSPEIRQSLQDSLGESVELFAPYFEAVIGAAFLPSLMGTVGAS
jgi:N-acetylglucosamine kinase-like BadF-type ATPase